MTDREHIQPLLTVARRYWLEQATQAEIAAEIGYSRSMVSRLLDEARRRGIITFTVQHPLERAIELEDALTRTFGLTCARVAMSNDNATADEVARMAADLVTTYMHPDSVIALSNGRGVASVVHAMTPIRRPGATVVQAIGGTAKGNLLLDSPELCRQLAERIGCAYRVMPAPVLVSNPQAAAALKAEERRHQRPLLLVVGARGEPRPEGRLGPGPVDRGVAHHTDDGGGRLEVVARLRELRPHRARHARVLRRDRADELLPRGELRDHQDREHQSYKRARLDNNWRNVVRQKDGGTSGHRHKRADIYAAKKARPLPARKPKDDTALRNPAADTLKASTQSQQNSAEKHQKSYAEVLRSHANGSGPSDNLDTPVQQKTPAQQKIPAHQKAQVPVAQSPPQAATKQISKSLAALTLSPELADVHAVTRLQKAGWPHSSRPSMQNVASPNGKGRQQVLNKHQDIWRSGRESKVDVDRNGAMEDSNALDIEIRVEYMGSKK